MSDVDQMLFVPGGPAPLVYTIPQVAALTGWSERSLMDECREGRAEYVNRKGTYGMTLAQIYKLAEVYTRQASKPATAAEAKRIAADETRRQVAAGVRSRGRSRAQRAAA